MATVSIELDTIEDFERKVVEEAARQLLETTCRLTEDCDFETTPGLVATVGSRVRSAVERDVVAKVKTMLDEWASASLEKVLQTTEFQRTDNYGTAIGSKQKLADFIEAHVKRLLQGTKGSPNESLLEKVIREKLPTAVDKVLGDALGVAAEDVTNAIRDTVEERLGALELSIKSRVAKGKR